VREDGERRRAGRGGRPLTASLSPGGGPSGGEHLRCFDKLSTRGWSLLHGSLVLSLSKDGAGDARPLSLRPG